MFLIAAYMFTTYFTEIENDKEKIFDFHGKNHVYFFSLPHKQPPSTWASTITMTTNPPPPAQDTVAPDAPSSQKEEVRCEVFMSIPGLSASSLCFD